MQMRLTETALKKVPGKCELPGKDTADILTHGGYSGFPTNPGCPEGFSEGGVLCQGQR